MMSRSPQHSSVRIRGERAPDARLTWGTCAALIAAICIMVACTPLGTRTASYGRFPGKLVAAKDGNLWFPEGPTGSNRIGWITPAGVVTEISIAPSSAEMLAVTPDGTIWFAHGNGEPEFGSLTPGGIVIPLAIPPTSNPRYLAASPDGNLWFTDAKKNAITRVTPKGVVTAFPLPTPDAAPWKIAAGPGNSLWFTESGADQIGRITETGKITEYPVTGGGEPDGIGAGPDDTVWFTEINTNVGGGSVGRVTLSGAVTLFQVAVLGSRSILSNPDAITLGPDGNLWFTSLSGGLGRSTPDGQISVVTLPHLSVADGITTGPDGNLWFADAQNNAIVRVTPSGKVTAFTLPFDHYTCGFDC